MYRLEHNGCAKLFQMLARTHTKRAAACKTLQWLLWQNGSDASARARARSHFAARLQEQVRRCAMVHETMCIAATAMECGVCVRPGREEQHFRRFAPSLGARKSRATCCACVRARSANESAVDSGKAVDGGVQWCAARNAFARVKSYRIASHHIAITCEWIGFHEAKLAHKVAAPNVERVAVANAQVDHNCSVAPRAKSHTHPLRGGGGGGNDGSNGAPLASHHLVARRNLIIPSKRLVNAALHRSSVSTTTRKLRRRRCMLVDHDYACCRAHARVANGRKSLI